MQAAGENLQDTDPTVRKDAAHNFLPEFQGRQKEKSNVTLLNEGFSLGIKLARQGKLFSEAAPNVCMWMHL